MKLGELTEILNKLNDKFDSNLEVVVRGSEDTPDVVGVFDDDGQDCEDLCGEPDHVYIGT